MVEDAIFHSIYLLTTKGRWVTASGNGQDVNLGLVKNDSSFSRSWRAFMCTSYVYIIM